MFDNLIANQGHLFFDFILTVISHRRGDIRKSILLSENLGMAFPKASSEKEALEKAENLLKSKNVQGKWEKNLSQNNGRLKDTLEILGKDLKPVRVIKPKKIVLPGDNGPMEELF